MARDLDYLGLAVRPGQWLTIHEADYMFGQGPLVFDLVGNVGEYGGIVWVELHGREVFSHGTKPRSVAVRLEALRGRS